MLQPILHRVAHTRSQEIFTALVVLLVLGSALLTEHIGLSMAMGAFIAGLLIADSPYRHELAREALVRDHGDASEIETLLRRFRDDHYADARRKQSNIRP